MRTDKTATTTRAANSIAFGTSLGFAEKSAKPNITHGIAKTRSSGVDTPRRKYTASPDHCVDRKTPGARDPWALIAPNLYVYTDRSRSRIVGATV